MDEIQTLKQMRTAIKQGDSKLFSELIASNVSLLDAMTPFGTLLHVAASFGRTEIVKNLLDLGIDINRRGGVFDGGAINEAATDGHIEVVRLLLKHGAELDISEPTRNPLFGAIHGGHLDIVRLLAETGIDICIKYTGQSMKNMDALAFAKERGQSLIAEYLATKLRQP
jgi:uncharacterized protein